MDYLQWSKLHSRVRFELTGSGLPAASLAEMAGGSKRLDLEPRGPYGDPELIDLVEEQASCELYGLLKRPDEKYVTEHAYDNPKFVEDMVRDIAAKLNQDDRVSSYTVESENFESIHNHSAYALIERNKETDPVKTDPE